MSSAENKNQQGSTPITKNLKTESTQNVSSIPVSVNLAQNSNIIHLPSESNNPTFKIINQPRHQNELHSVAPLKLQIVNPNNSNNNNSTVTTNSSNHNNKPVINAKNKKGNPNIIQISNINQLSTITGQPLNVGSLNPNQVQVIPVENLFQNNPMNSQSIQFPQANFTSMNGQTVQVTPVGSGTSLIKIQNSSNNNNNQNLTANSNQMIPQNSKTQSTNPSQQIQTPINLIEKPRKITHLVNACDLLPKNPELFLLGTAWFFSGTGRFGTYQVDPLLEDSILRYGGIVIHNEEEVEKLATHIIMTDQGKIQLINQVPGDMTKTSITHDGNYFRYAMSKNKFAVTIDYLRDLLVEKYWSPPWKMTHIPFPIAAQNSICPMGNYLVKKEKFRASDGNLVEGTSESNMISNANKTYSTKHANKPTSLQLFLKNHVFTVTGYNLKTRLEITSILKRLGCKVDNHMNRSITMVVASNTSVACGKNFTEKIKIAKEWKIHVVTTSWLRDVLAGIKSSCTATGIVKYYVNLEFAEKLTVESQAVSVNGGNNNNSNLSGRKTSALSIILHKLWKNPIDEMTIDPDKCNTIMSNYAQPRFCNIEVLERIACDIDIKLMQSLPISDPLYNFLPLSLSGLTNTNKNMIKNTSDLQNHIKNSTIINQISPEKQSQFNLLPFILITGFSDETTLKLVKIVEHLAKLGQCRLTKNMTNCTHLVTNEIKRSVKFLTAINVCQFVLTEDWLLESEKKNRIQKEEEQYFLSDRINENKFNVNLAQIFQKRTKDRDQKLMEIRQEIHNFKLKMEKERISKIQIKNSENEISQDSTNASGTIKKKTKKSENLPKNISQNPDHYLSNLHPSVHYHSITADFNQAVSKRTQIFKHLHFTATPNISPNLQLLQPIILSAGGSIIDGFPVFDEICRYHKLVASNEEQESQGRIVILADLKDQIYLENLHKIKVEQQIDNFSIVSTEFVLACCLWQEVNFEKFEIGRDKISELDENTNQLSSRTTVAAS